jgi:7-cyano-7-deazaguanine synthase
VVKLKFMAHKSIAIVSGGLDSTVLAYLLRAGGDEIHFLSFDYGQRHKKELEFAALSARNLGARHSILDLSGLAPLLGGNALTDDSVPVPHGHYEAPNMAITVVPNRNAVMLALAYSVAVAENSSRVAIGVHGGDHAIYPDCRPEFVEAFEKMQKQAIEGFGDPNLQIFAPFLNSDKAGIVRQGAKLNVPFEQTWSCYEGGALHCGKCGTCVERREAFEAAGVKDPTQYAR